MRADWNRWCSQRRITMSMQQVAQLAGVSTATVSRCFNNLPCVSPRTLEVVRQAALELGVVPASRQRSRVPRRTSIGHTVALVVFGIRAAGATPLFDRLLRAVVIAADEHALSVTLNFVPDAADLPRRLLELPLAGVLGFGEEPSGPRAAALRSLPTVWLMSGRGRPTWGDQVMPNHVAAGEAAGRYLARRGHRRLAYIAAGPDACDGMLRAFAFRRAAEDAGAEVDFLDARAVPDADVATRVTDWLRAGGSLPTGLFVESEPLLGAIRDALHRRGPTDEVNAVEAITCAAGPSGDADPSRVVARLDVRPEAVARRAVEQLVWRMNNPDAPERVRLMVQPALLVSPRPAAAGAGWPDADRQSAGELVTPAVRAGSLISNAEVS